MGETQERDGAKVDKGFLREANKILRVSLCSISRLRLKGARKPAPRIACLEAGQGLLSVRVDNAKG